MSNIGSRFRKLITDPKTTIKKIHHKFKYDRKGAWYLISSELNGDSKLLYQKVRKHLPLKYKGSSYFTIISACYNVEKYLDEYFKSIVAQSLDFKKHIQIICVDDGSQDNTAAIIKKWQKNYPKNIHYIYKENGGQASARNLGLEYVETEWVTFIDPDDFISADYFREIDDAIGLDPSLLVLVSNLQFYMESQGIVKDGHPLKFRFKNKKNKYNILDLKDTINLSASSSMFKTDIIKSNNIMFDHRVRPNFEDGKFISDYSLVCGNGSLVYLKDSVYFYRKRQDESSTIDTSWTKLEKYSNVLEFGFIPMLENYANKFGLVPKHIQRTALYDMSWYVKYLLNNKEKISFLSDEQKKYFLELLIKIFSFIDRDIILNFNLAGIWFMHKVGMLGLFKNEHINSNIIYIENIDREKKQILLSFYTYFDELEYIELGGKEIFPVYGKTVINNFGNKFFVKEKRYWIQFNELNDILKITLNKNNSRISLFGKQYKEIKISEIISRFKPSEKYASDDSWLLMDRDIQADDNAEHLYRFIKNNYPSKKCYFALNRNSHDWQRLEDEGFNLVDYGTKEFEKILCRCSRIISSHLDRYINNYFGDEYQYSKKYVFLQHGITKDDMSSWFNGKKNLQCLITSTFSEFASIADGDSYKLCRKDVVLTGFPRHDALLAGNQAGSKTILIMPTWRQSIVGHIIANGNQRELNKEFMLTDYAQNWSAVLHSDRLKMLSEKYGYKVVFAPHANIEPYLEQFTVPEYISIWSAKTSHESIQELFQTSKLMITDFSSVAFEMAYLRKLVIYFQFDAKEVFSSQSHIYKKGYFSYEENGFGPVTETADDLLNELEKALKNNGEPLEPYKTRIEETFPFRDGKNCERVYQAIKALDEPETKEIDLDVLQEFVCSAYKNRIWDSLFSRCELLEKYGNEKQQRQVQDIKLYALANTFQFETLETTLKEYTEYNPLVIEIRAIQMFLQEEWQRAIDYLTALSTLNREQQFMLLRCYAELKQSDELEKIITGLSDLTSNERIICNCWLLASQDNWAAVAELLNDNMVQFTQHELEFYKPELLLARAFRMLGQYDDCHNQLAQYTNDDSDCHIEIAHLAFARQKYGKVLSQLAKASFGNFIYLPKYSLIEFLISLDKIDKLNELSELINEIIEKRGYDTDISLVIVNILVKYKEWKKILLLAPPLYEQRPEEVIYPLVLANVRIGLIKEAYKLHLKPTSDSLYEYWEIICDLALIQGDLELARYCLSNMIAIFPERNKEANLQNLISLSK